MDVKVKYEKIDKMTEDVKVDDEIRIGGLLCTVTKIRTNDHDDLVWDLDIVGAKFKRRSKIMLILPKKVPVTTLA
jgi:preprotein translocase subunit YajC